MEAINWDAVGALSEAFGVIAVVTSLIFVGLQIRQSTNASKIEAIRNVSSEWRGVYKGAADNSQLAEVLYRGFNDYKNLDGAELMQYNAAMHQIFHVAARQSANPWHLNIPMILVRPFLMSLSQQCPLNPSTNVGLTAR